jgi:glucose-6-phosphate 1-epimerase
MSAHGGHLLSWCPGGKADRLWLSPLASADDGGAIRGGVPVIFPRFAAHPLTDADGEPIDAPRHGVARTTTWQVDQVPDDQAAVLGAALRDDEQTRADWPFAFALALVARATADRLTLTLDVANAGDEPIAFSAALHTYLAVSDAALARVTGLGHGLSPDPRPAWGPFDEVHEGVAASGVHLVDPELGSLTVSAGGFTDVVFWNPGPGHGLADVPEDGASHFVCIEALALHPIVLAAGQTWSGTQILAIQE